MMTKKCSDCLWFDMCGDDKTCDNYAPADDAHAETETIREYEQDLLTRKKIYDDELVELEVIECP